MSADAEGRKLAVEDSRNRLFLWRRASRGYARLWFQGASMGSARLLHSTLTRAFLINGGRCDWWEYTLFEVKIYLNILFVRGPRQGSPSKRTAGGKTAVGSPIVWRAKVT